jgi:hypothetical protein
MQRLKQWITSAREIWEARQLPTWLTNKYFVVGAAYLLLTLFLVDHNYFERRKIKRELKEVLAEKNYYESQLHDIDGQLEILLRDDETLERFAREKYLMKTEDEEVFVIIEK